MENKLFEVIRTKIIKRYFKESTSSLDGEVRTIKTPLKIKNVISYCLYFTLLNQINCNKVKIFVI